MDTELLKTFIEVSRTRHFGRAADNLFLTQSAVSARIKLLEDTLNVQLFSRDRNNIQLTSAGSRLLKHAGIIVNAWNQTVQDMAMDEDSRILLNIGGLHSIWDSYLQEKINILYGLRPDLAMRLDTGDQLNIIRRLLDSTLDMGFIFEAPQMPELITREVARIELIQVASQPDLDSRSAANHANYILVDWGVSFEVQHARLFPEMPPPALHMSMGRMALSFMLANGGVAYLAHPMVKNYIRKQRLFQVRGSEPIERIVYMACAAGSPRQDICDQVYRNIRADTGQA